MFDTAGKSAVVGDLFRIYGVSRRAGAGYHWTTIPDGVEFTGDEIFDPAKMNELYDLGYKTALTGPQWFTDSPGLGTSVAP